MLKRGTTRETEPGHRQEEVGPALMFNVWCLHQKTLRAEGARSEGRRGDEEARGRGGEIRRDKEREGGEEARRQGDETTRRRDEEKR